MNPIPIAFTKHLIALDKTHRFQITNDALNRSASHTGLNRKTLDRRPAQTFIVCPICQRQKDKLLRG
jgi:hypothetical protein